MLTNLPAAVVMIVFAGGPHTPERTDLACELLTSCQPVAVYLTGEEYRGDYSNLVAKVTDRVRPLQPVAPPVLTDTCSSTWESCRALARTLRAQYPDGASIVVVTSNYHAPRARWLLAGLLPGNLPVTVRTSHDIPWHDCLATPRNRTLVLGECLSWPYCFFLGFVCRPWLLVATLMVAFGCVAFRRRSRGGRV